MGRRLARCGFGLKWTWLFLSAVTSDKCGAVLGHEFFDRHWRPTADLRSNRIRFSENSFLQFDCLRSAVLFEKSIAGLANRLCEGIDTRLLIGNVRTEDTTGDLCDFRKTMLRRTTEWIRLPAMGYWVFEYRDDHVRQVFSRHRCKAGIGIPRHHHDSLAHRTSDPEQPFAKECRPEMCHGHRRPVKNLLREPVVDRCRALRARA